MKNFKKMLLRKKIMKMPSLPTLPANVIELMQMLRDPKVSASQVIDSISQDQVLAAQILRLVNSGYYSVRNKVNSIEHAVALVGFVKVWEMLLSSSVMSIISGREKNLWYHSYSSSILMREMIEKEKVRCSPKLQLTMLMHDIGKIVLVNYNPQTHNEISEESQDQNRPISELEEERIGVNHAEVGGWLLEGWELGDDQILPISLHHSEEVPVTFACETTMIKIVDYCDNAVRGHAAVEPDPDELTATGLSHITPSKWLERHQKIIEELGTEEAMEDPRGTKHQIKA